MRIAIGVDSHKATLAFSAVDELGRHLATRQVTNDRAGHEQALAWINEVASSSRVVGIEGSGSFGAALAWFLLDRGEDVREVPAFMTYRERNRRRSDGKSDPVDALAIARVAAREKDLSTPKRAGIMVDLKLLNDHREQLIRARTRLANQAHRQLIIMRPGYQRTIPTLRSKKHVRNALMLLQTERGVRGELTRQRLKQMLTLDGEIYALGKRIEATLEESKTALTQIAGVGAFVAATILGEVGQISRVRSKAAFASMAGAAPLEASSGKTSRHRMNHGGNRRLNRALHVMAKTQSRVTPQARAYVTRKMEEGRTYKEALRALQRHLANVVYKTLVEDARRLEMAT